MDVLRQPLHVLHRRRRQNAVAQIEDMPDAAADARENVVRLAEHAVDWAEQKCGIEIALDRAVVPNALPGDIDRYPTSPPAARSSSRIADVPVPK